MQGFGGGPSRLLGNKLDLKILAKCSLNNFHLVGRRRMALNRANCGLSLFHADWKRGFAQNTHCRKVYHPYRQMTFVSILRWKGCYFQSWKLLGKNTPHFRLELCVSQLFLTDQGVGFGSRPFDAPAKRKECLHGKSFICDEVPQNPKSPWLRSPSWASQLFLIFPTLTLEKKWPRVCRPHCGSTLCELQ